MSHFIFTISVNALKEQINRAYEEDNCEDLKTEHLSEVILTFPMVSRCALLEEILAADTFFFSV